jgi:hypothetical protein
MISADLAKDRLPATSKANGFCTPLDHLAPLHRPIVEASFTQQAYTEKSTDLRSKAMVEATPQSTFHGLPLTPEQDAEVRHYIKRKTQHGAPWNTAELRAMLDDMLQPPSDEDGGSGAIVSETRAATERATASVDEAMEPIEASEERHAAAEAEGMKGFRL